MGSDKADIWCPRCRWRPKPESRWVCTPSCGAVWHTFWTRGVCPGCAVKWPHTACHACEKFSPHEAWYHYRDPGEGEKVADPASLVAR
jgi:predicted amidophosphoribosyltransferase